MESPIERTARYDYDTDAEIRYLQSLRDIIDYWQKQCKAVRLRPAPSDPGWRLREIETMMSMIWHQLYSMTKGNRNA